MSVRPTLRGERLCLAWALALTLCSSALAQAGGAAGVESPGYRTAVDQALAEYQALDFEEARALFSKAHAIFPNARTLRGLGMVEFELRDYRQSADYLTQALESRVRPLNGELRASTEELLSRAHGFLAGITLKVQPKAVRLLLDGAPIEFQPDAALVVQVGDHVLEIQAEGYAPEKRQLTIQGGEQLTLQVSLRANAATALAPETSSSAAPVLPGPVHGESAEHENARPAGLWPWVVVGVSGATLVAGGVLVALAQGDISNVEGADKGTRWSKVTNAYDAAPAKSTTGFVLLGVGAAGLVTGLLWQLAWNGKPGQAGSVQLGIDSDRVTVRGSF